MSLSQPRAFLVGQITLLRERLALRAAGDVMGRLSLQAQIDDFEAQLQELAEMPTWRPAVVRLAFTGNPVVGSVGVEPAFAAKAVVNFDELVRLVRAEEFSLPLPDSGPIPAPAGAGRMLVTGIVRSSFGFELTEEAPTQLGLDQSPTVQALRRVTRMLGSLAGNEDTWDDAAPAHGRVRSKLGDFLAWLGDHDATLKLDSEAGRVELGHDEIARGTEVARSTNVAVSQVERPGYLVVMTLTRKFQLLDSNNAISHGITGDLAATLDEAAVRALFDLTRAHCVASLTRRVVMRGERVRESWTLLAARPATGA